MHLYFEFQTGSFSRGVQLKPVIIETFPISSRVFEAERNLGVVNQNFLHLCQ
jgi:hypothetical protein